MTGVGSQQGGHRGDGKGPMKRIRLLLVHESMVCRDLMRSAFDELEDVDVVAVAPNGKIGLDLVRLKKPDCLLMSASAGSPSAAEVTREALKVHSRLGILVVANQQDLNAGRVVKALEEGAIDFGFLPGGEDREVLIQAVKRLLPKLRSISTIAHSRWARSVSQGKSESQPEMVDSTAKAVAALRNSKAPDTMREIEVVVIGLSTGGPELLSRVIPAIPAALPVPVVIVLHMPAQFSSSLASVLDDKSQVTVKEGADGDILARGVVYLAPGGVHLTMERSTRRQLMLRTNDAPPENGCKPAVDVLFRSAAVACPQAVLALILTGMGDDGVKGLRALKQAGAHVLAQDELSSVIWGMPGSAVRAGVVDEIVPRSKLVDRVLEIVGV